MKLNSKIKEAKRIIKSIIGSSIESTCLAWSGGKDATACWLLFKEIFSKDPNLVIALVSTSISPGMEQIFYQSNGEPVITIGLMGAPPGKDKFDERWKYLNLTAVYDCGTTLDSHILRMYSEYLKLAYLAQYNYCISGFKLTDSTGSTLMDLDSIRGKRWITNAVKNGLVRVSPERDTAKGKEIPITHCAPLYNWTDDEVMTYLDRKGILKCGKK